MKPFDEHDTTRGLAWLATYLKTEPGARLLDTLDRQSPNSDAKAKIIHLTALKYATLNVNRCAEDNGTSPERAERSSSWVGAGFKANEVSLQRQSESQDAPASGQKPEVYVFDKETIAALGKKSDARAEKPSADRPAQEQQRELTLERFR